LKLPRALRPLYGWALPLMAIASLAPAIAIADPCKAIPDNSPRQLKLRAPMLVSGPVVYVGDGDGICVAGTPGRERDPGTWVEVRLEDFYPPELNAPGGRAAKDALTGIAMGRRVSCLGVKLSYDRLVARCSLGGNRFLGDLMRRAGVREGGNR